MRLSTASLAVILAFAPASARAGFKCPAQGGSQWHEYRSKHFVVQTDAGAAKVALLVSRLESMHALELQALMGEQVEIPGRLRVIAFTDPRLFTELAGTDKVSGYYKSSAFGERTIVLPIEGLEADPQLVAHELAYHLSSFIFIRQPAWFSEGLAHFVETIAVVGTRFEAAIGTHVVRGQRDHDGAAGTVPFAMASALQEAPRVSFKELVAWNGLDDTRGASYHLYSWLLYHWLWNTRSKQFSGFQERLSNGDDPTAAWRASFPEFDPDKPGAAEKLDDAIEGYRRLGGYVSYRVQAASDPSFQETASIPSADAHMVIQDAIRSWPVDDQIANVQEALREDDSQPAAILARSLSFKTSPLEPLRKAVAKRPRDWRAWLALGRALGDSAPAEREAAYRKAVELNPDSAAAQNGLAWSLAASGRAKEALPNATRALDLVPSEPSYMDTLAVVAAQLGKCSEALVLERRAAGMVPASSPSGREFAKRIAGWEAGCGPAAPAAASVAPSPAR
jgi:Flp pilus assembly protein TadD